MKNMVFNSKVLLSIVLIALLLFVVPVSAVDVGVKADDWAKYDVSFTWEGPPEEKAPEVEVWEKFEWFQVTVQSVSVKTITARWLIHLNNGTELNWTIKGDISIGSENVTAFFTPKNLNEGDMIPGLWEIDEIIPRDYFESTRDVYHLSKHETGSTTRYDYTSDYEYYFDRATGILCEYSGTFSADYDAYTITMSFNYIMTETNLWSPPPPPPPFWTQWWLWAIIVVVVVVIASVAIFMMRRKKPKPIIITPPGT